MVTAACVLIGLFALYQVFSPLAQGNQVSLILFLAAVLPLTLLCYRSGLRLRRAHRRSATAEPDADRLAARRGGVGGVPLPGAALPIRRRRWRIRRVPESAGHPAAADVIVGTIVVLLVLEACRRTTGVALPIVCVLALGYAYYGGYLPQGAAIAHAGVDWDQIISASFIQSTGLYGVPLDVAATYIVLFTIYGAVLDASGASKFFIDLSFAAFRRSRAAPGRTVTLAGFLLGSVSGSGTATTVSLGSVTWPVLRRAGYPAENAGGMLAAAGIGAILSPPTLGAAAFIIAEYLGVPYLTVLVWAIVPTILYYLGILLAVEIDARRYGTREVEVTAQSTWRLLGRFGYHLISLVMIVVFLAMDMSAVRAVVYATAVQIVLSFLDREHRLTPAKALRRAGHRRSGRPLRGGGMRRRRRHRGDDHPNRAGPATELHPGQHRALDHRKPHGCIDSHRDIRRTGGIGPWPGGAGHGVVRDQLGDHRTGAAGSRRSRPRRGDVRLLFRGALRSDPADRTGRGRRIRDHRRQGDRHHVADVEVHPAGVPGAVRIRADRQRRRPARAAVVRRHGLDGGGGRAGRGRARRRHRRLAGPSCGLAGAAAVRACGGTAAVPEPGDDRRGGRPVSGGRGRESRYHSQTTSGITRSAASR